MVGFTKNVGYQYAKSGIRCNAIAPGGVNTNIGTTMNEPGPFGMERAMSGITINPRSGEPEEIAKVALFLASDEASFVNGAVVTADAGWTIHGFNYDPSISGRQTKPMVKKRGAYLK